MGRTSYYDMWKREGVLQDKLLLITAWARDGLIETQIADNLGIEMSTLSAMKVKYPEFKEALKKGKEVVDYQVENALLKRALGYKYDEVTKELTGNQEDGYEMKVTKIVTKEVAPDVTAQIYWSKNRNPQRWNERKAQLENMEIEDLTTIADMLKGGAPHVEENTND
jgi:predicted transcriptional regulator